MILSAWQRIVRRDYKAVEEFKAIKNANLLCKQEKKCYLLAEKQNYIGERWKVALSPLFIWFFAITHDLPWLFSIKAFCCVIEQKTNQTHHFKMFSLLFCNIMYNVRHSFWEIWMYYQKSRNFISGDWSMLWC